MIFLNPSRTDLHWRVSLSVIDIGHRHMMTPRVVFLLPRYVARCRL
jgi:hypothetical protein